MKAILFCLDTLRADHLSSHGYPRSTSPNIDRLAEEGALFLDATSAWKNGSLWQRMTRSPRTLFPKRCVRP